MKRISFDYHGSDGHLSKLLGEILSHMGNISALKVETAAREEKPEVVLEKQRRHYKPRVKAALSAKSVRQKILGFATEKKEITPRDVREFAASEGLPPKQAANSLHALRLAQILEIVGGNKSDGYRYRIKKLAASKLPNELPSK